MTPIPNVSWDKGVFDIKMKPEIKLSFFSFFYITILNLHKESIDNFLNP